MDILNAIVDTWLSKIKSSKEHKRKVFQKTADRIWKYYGSDHRFVYFREGEDAGDSPFPSGQPSYKATINKTAEYVHLMLPSLHHKVPIRRVATRRPVLVPELFGAPPGAILPPSPTQQQDRVRAFLLEWFLNYTAGESTFDLRGEGRGAVIEALTKGRGVLWHEMIETQDGMLPGSFFDSVDNLFLDPDAVRLREAGYAIRRRRRPIWEVAEEFELDPKELRRAYKDFSNKSVDSVEESKDLKDLTDGADGKDDVCVYYEVYSRVGVGQKFAIADAKMKQVADMLDQLDPHAYLVIMPGVKYPLNLPEHLMEAPDAEGEIVRAMEWPVKFFGDTADPWPFSCLDFYPSPDCIWPTPPLKAALPLQAFLDYAYSFLMGRVRTTCRDIIVTSKAMQKDLKDAIVSGLDQTVVGMDGTTQELEKLIHILQFPMVNMDLWRVIEAIERNFEKATGLTELAYGNTGPTQPRSAAEMQVRQGNMSIRPGDMAECVESFMSRSARKEAIATRLYVGPEAVGRLLGETPQEGSPAMGPLTQAWAMLINTPDPYTAAAEMDYTVEAGSGRKPNKDKQLADIQDSAQTILPILMGRYQMTGDPTQVNAWFRRWGEAQDMDVTEFMLPPQSPPMPMGPEGPPPGQGGPPPM